MKEFHVGLDQIEQGLSSCVNGSWTFEPYIDYANGGRKTSRATLLKVSSGDIIKLALHNSLL
jgi:hypothetical protein